MDTIVKELTVWSDAGRTTVPVRFVPGTRWSLIRRDLAERLSRLWVRLTQPKRFRIPGVVEPVATDMVCGLELNMKGKDLDGYFHIVDVLPDPLILGADFFYSWEITIDSTHDDYTVGIDPSHIEMGFTEVA